MFGILCIVGVSSCKVFAGRMCGARKEIHICTAVNESLECSITSVVAAILMPAVSPGVFDPKRSLPTAGCVRCRCEALI